MNFQKDSWRGSWCIRLSHGGTPVVFCTHRRMNGMSPSTTPNVATSVATIHYVEPKPVLKASMIEVLDNDAHLQRTWNPTPNSELCLDIDYEPNLEPKQPTIPKRPKWPAPSAKQLVEDTILDKCCSLYPNLPQIREVPSKWVHHGCEREIDKQLVNALLFLDCELAISVLQQLHQPRSQLENCRPHKIGKIDSNSIVVPMSLTSLIMIDAPSTNAVDALLDCGTSGWGYLHQNWVANHDTIPRFPCITLMVHETAVVPSPTRLISLSLLEGEKSAAHRIRAELVHHHKIPHIVE